MKIKPPDLDLLWWIIITLTGIYLTVSGKATPKGFLIEEGIHIRALGLVLTIFGVSLILNHVKKVKEYKAPDQPNKATHNHQSE
jgi:hypothetical protein